MTVSHDGIFATTRWTLVMAARQSSPESAAALEAICRAYWHPLYAYARRCGQSPQDAEDLTQTFFCHLLEKHLLDAADHDKGRLRSFLIASLKHFIGCEWRRSATQRRGGRHTHVPIDTVFAESRLATDPHALSPDETYDQQWALALLDLTINRLSAEFDAAGKSADFETLKGCLMAGRGAIDYAATARQLGVSEGAARVAVHRLRKRFREIFREEISLTLDEGADMDEEMRHLATALARGPGQAAV